MKLLKSIKETGEKEKLQSFEIPNSIFVEKEITFTTENGLLTPSEKLCRPKLKKKYAPIINSLAKQKEELLNNSLKLERKCNNILEIISQVLAVPIEQISIESFITPFFSKLF